MSQALRILFVGESWLGSCARSMKEALARLPDAVVDEVNEDLYLPKGGPRWIRGINRFLYGTYRRHLYEQISARARVFRPQAIVAYKGFHLSADFLRSLQRSGVKLVNIYPDCSPHAHGEEHREALGVYDLVISTKPFHPPRWNSVYGYRNPCEFVPQGFDPTLHLEESPASDFCFDVSLVATYRAEYARLLQELARKPAMQKLTFGIGGNGWQARKSSFPAHWVVTGELHGRSYAEWLRRGRITIAPVTREMAVNGQLQPGDEDTTRSYELAAAHCFFIHRRTPFIQTVYDEETEVPMYDSAEELADKIAFFAANESLLAERARRAHLRAVPAYSLDRRAEAIAALMKERFEFSE